MTRVPVCAQVRVEVIVENLKDTAGWVHVALFSSQDSFLKTPLKGKTVKTLFREVTVVFENVPQGVYAASIIHDTNRNGKLDTNFFGVPKEGFGFSNDVMGTLGPPSFDKAKFSLQSPLTIRIRARYF